jgi:hypothetical protein
MARRTISVTESDDKSLPKGMHWRTVGKPAHPDYMVRYDRGGMDVRHSHCASLTQARKEARAIVREGRAWAEVFRWAESGVSMRSVFIASYEVEIESGASL